MKSLLVALATALLALQAVPGLAAEGIPGATVRADSGKGHAERQARREQWCKDNPERCAQAKARVEERRKRCEANPAECRPARRPGAGA